MITNNLFTFNSSSEVEVSNDLSNSVLTFIEDGTYKSAALIVDEVVQKSEILVQLKKSLSDKKVLTKFSSIKVSEPTTYMVDDLGNEFSDSKLDLLIGVGGGSLLDLVKALSVFLKTGTSIVKKHADGVKIYEAIDKVLIPTTAGTGSEVTPGAVLVNPETNFKRALGGPAVSAKRAILCPELTLSLPRELTATIGMDALAHATESFTAKCSNSVTRMYSKEAFRLISKSLPIVMDSPTSLEHRHNMLLGSCLAGYAIYNSNTGAAHSMAYPMGIYHGVNHGFAITLLLPEIVKHNEDLNGSLYNDLMEFLPQEYKNQRLSAFLYSLLDSFSLKTRLSDFGVKSSDIDFLSQRGLDLKPALSNNPVDFNEEDSIRVLKNIFR